MSTTPINVGFIDLTNISLTDIGTEVIKHLYINRHNDADLTPATKILIFYYKDTKVVIKLVDHSFYLNDANVGSDPFNAATLVSDIVNGKIYQKVMDPVQAFRISEALFNKLKDSK